VAGLQSMVVCVVLASTFGRVLHLQTARAAGARRCDGVCTALCDHNSSVSVSIPPFNADGTHRLEPGDVVEFAVEAYPGAGTGHRKAAAEVRFLSKVRWYIN